MNLEKIGKALHSIAFKVYATVTLSFPHEEVEKIRTNLEIHKTPEEKSLDEQEKQLREEHRELAKKKDAAEKFGNKEKVEEYEKALSENFFKFEELHDKRYELTHSSKYEKELRNAVPEINWVSVNLHAVLTALGYEISSEYGMLDPHDIVRRAIKLKNSLKEQKKLKGLERERVDETGERGARVFSPEFTSQDILDRVDRLVDLANKAIKLGINEIHYG